MVGIIFNIYIYENIKSAQFRVVFFRLVEYFVYLSEIFDETRFRNAIVRTACISSTDVVSF